MRLFIWHACKNTNQGVFLIISLANGVLMRLKLVITFYGNVNFSNGCGRLVQHQPELLGLVQKGSPCWAPIGVPVDDICALISSCIFICFSFIWKICNRAALAVAIETLSSPSEHVWLEDYLVSITCTVWFILTNMYALIYFINFSPGLYILHIIIIYTCYTC